MGILSSILSGGASTVVDSVGGVLDNLFTSDEEREEAKRLMAVVQDKPHQDQRDIGKSLVAKAGAMSWHNALGWVCALAMAAFYLPQYSIGAFVWVKACAKVGWQTLPAYPVDASGLLELIVAMLGLAGKVTIERIAKVRPTWRP